MKIPCPQEILEFESFLRQNGFKCERTDVVSEFGDFALRADKENICVDVVIDRSKWYVSVGEDRANSSKQYDPQILRDFLGDAGEDAVSLPEQIAIVQRFFPQIIAMFSPESSEQTHRKLKTMQMERLKRRSPRLYEQVRKFVQ